MNTYDGRKDRLLNGLTQVCGVLTAIFGFVALFGWIAGLPLLYTFGPGLIPMAPSTALLFLLFGTEALLFTRSPPDRAVHRIGMVIGSVSTLIALLLFFLSYGGIYLGAEHLGIRIDGTVKGAPIGHMSPLTAFCFVLVGLSFLASLSTSDRRWLAATAFGFASLVVLTSIALLLAYLFGSPLLYGSSVIPPALSTSLAFLTLGTALMVSSVQRAWPSGKLLDTSSIRATYMLVLIFVSLGTGIVAAGYFYFQSYEKSYKAEIERQLSAIAELKVGELVQWRKERLGDGAVFYKNPNFAGLVQRFLEAPGDRDARVRLQTWLYLVREAYQYDRVFLLDTKAVGRISAPDAREPITPPVAQIASEVLRSGQVAFLDFHRDAEGQPIHLSVLVPIFEKRDPGRRLGILVLRIDPEKYLYPFINRWPTPSKTAETLIIRRDGNDALFLNELRFQKNTALNLRSPLGYVQMPAVKAGLGQEGIVEGIDYRGVPVIAYVRSVPNSPWSLVARMEASEVCMPLRKRLWEIVILIGALLICAGAGVGMVWRHQRTRFYRERYEVAEELRASEARCRSTLDNMLEGCQTIGFDWRYLYVNDSAARYGRQDKEELLGRTIMERYPGVEATKMFAVLRHCMEERTPQLMENEFTYPDGAKAWFELCIQPVPEGIFILSLDITERKQAEEALRESEDRYRDLVENSQDLICTHDLQGQFLSANPIVVKLLGYDRSAILKMNVRDILPPDVRDQFSSYLDTIRRDGVAKGLMSVQTATGERRILEYNNTLRTKGVTSPIVRAINHDITERKRAKQALRESEERYRTLVETSPDAITLFDLNLNILMANRPALTLYGYERQEDIIGKSVLDFLVPEQLARAREDIEKVLGTGGIGTVEYTLLKRDRTLFPAELRASLILDREKKPNAILCVSRDITERKAAEEALKESEQRFRALFEQAAVGVAQIETETGRFLRINQRYCDIVGYTIEEMQNLTFKEITHPEDLQVDLDNVKFLIEGKIREFSIEKRYYHKNGSIVWVNLTLSPMWAIGGNPNFHIAVVQDITERKRAEQEMTALQEQLRQSQKMEAIGQLAGGIAHDFNNLLTVIKGYSQLSQMELKEGDPLKENLGEIGKAAERAANLTRQILAFSRRQVMEMRVLDLNTILKDLDKMLRRVIGEDVELGTLLAGELGRVRTDPGQIEQVIMNLAVNARDAMPHGGKLTIETANVELDEHYARNHIAVKPGRYVMLSVSDTGVGMAPEIRDRIFEPFFTTKEKGKGTGLGLSTVYGIVKQSGGNIWVYSEPNHGTAIKIYLPRVDEPLEEIKEEMVREEIHRGGETILLVEDEEEVRKLAIRVLERQGYTVLEAHDGEEALFLCKERKEPIHLILTDVVMPQMGGPRLVDQLKQVRQDFKVLYMSGYTDNSITHQGVLEKGMNYIQKPFTIDGLIRKVREALDQSNDGRWTRDGER